MQYLYRYQETHYAPPVNEWDEVVGEGRTEVTLWAYPVVRETPKGVWISIGFRDTKFVNLMARKQYASVTIEGAANQFRKRKEREIAIYETRIRKVQKALACTLPTNALIPLLVRGG